MYNGGNHPPLYNANSMLVLALDTTTRRGSLALTRDDAEVGVEIGDSAPHGVWLPGAIASLLARHRFGVRDIDLFAVASGPGSFTGLRIGIAAVQGLALAGDRGVVTVSALDALNHAAGWRSRQGSNKRLLVPRGWMVSAGRCSRRCTTARRPSMGPSSSTPKRCCDAGARFRPGKPWSSSGMDR